MVNIILFKCIKQYSYNKSLCKITKSKRIKNLHLYIECTSKHGIKSISFNIVFTDNTLLLA